MPRPTPDVPEPGQESVWDYPRPPRLERSSAHIEIVFGGVTIASTRHAFRVLETSHPPSYYLPPDSIVAGVLRPSSTRPTVCEWKGMALYFSVVVGAHEARDVAWAYPRPTRAFADIVDHVAFYPAAMDECRVDGEVVTAQPGGFYGGWITSKVAGPFKGIPGSHGW
jgi:uncharacterized protein (DUF427 family)